MFSVDTGRKLNVLCTFSLRPVSAGFCLTIQFVINVVAAERFFWCHEDRQNIDVDIEYSRRGIFFTRNKRKQLIFFKNQFEITPPL